MHLEKFGPSGSSRSLPRVARSRGGFIVLKLLSQFRDTTWTLPNLGKGSPVPRAGRAATRVCTSSDVPHSAIEGSLDRNFRSFPVFDRDERTACNCVLLIFAHLRGI